MFLIASAVRVEVFEAIFFYSYYAFTGTCSTVLCESLALCRIGSAPKKGPEKARGVPVLTVLMLHIVLCEVTLGLIIVVVTRTLPLGSVVCITFFSVGILYNVPMHFFAGIAHLMNHVGTNCTISAK